jgi:hypothetical protein
LLEAHGGRPKKLLIAVSSTFKRWWKDGTGEGGETDCYRCDGNDENCLICNGKGIVEFWGPAEAQITDYVEDIYSVVWMVWSCRKRAWTPTDFERHSAWFMSAFFYLVGRVLREETRIRKAAMEDARSGREET